MAHNAFPFFSRSPLRFWKVLQRPSVLAYYLPHLIPAPLISLLPVDLGLDLGPVSPVFSFLPYEVVKQWSGHRSVSHLVMPDSLQPHGLQPTRLPCPWDSPGKDTGVSHFLLRGCRRQSLSRKYDGDWVILKVTTTALLPRRSNQKPVSTFVYCWHIWNQAPGLWLFPGDPLLDSEFVTVTVCGYSQLSKPSAGRCHEHKH